MTSLGRVLVVDDDPNVASLLEDALIEFGYEVRIAATGHEALAVVTDYQPVVVLLDLWLPDLPGESVLEALLREVPTAPVIIVSGNRDAGRARALLQIGAFDYVAKPFELTSLEHALAAAVIDHDRRLQK